MAKRLTTTTPMGSWWSVLFARRASRLSDSLHTWRNALAWDDQHVPNGKAHIYAADGRLVRSNAKTSELEISQANDSEKGPDSDNHTDDDVHEGSRPKSKASYSDPISSISRAPEISNSYNQICIDERVQLYKCFYKKTVSVEMDLVAFQDPFLAICSHLLDDPRTLSRLAVTCTCAYSIVHSSFLVSELISSKPNWTTLPSIYTAKLFCVPAMRLGLTTENWLDTLEDPAIHFSDPYIEECLLLLLESVRGSGRRPILRLTQVLEHAGWQLAPAPANPSLLERLHSLGFHMALGLRPKRLIAMYRALGWHVMVPVARSWLLFSSFTATILGMALNEDVPWTEIASLVLIKSLALLGDLILGDSSRDIAILLPLALWKMSSVISIMMGLVNDCTIDESQY